MTHLTMRPEERECACVCAHGTCACVCLCVSMCAHVSVHVRVCAQSCPMHCLEGEVWMEGSFPAQIDHFRMLNALCQSHLGFNCIYKLLLVSWMETKGCLNKS